MLPIPGVLPLPRGSIIDISSDRLRDMSLDELKTLGQEAGISLAGLEDRISAILTRIVQHAQAVEP